jgi:hypothetical protein
LAPSLPIYHQLNRVIENSINPTYQLEKGKRKNFKVKKLCIIIIQRFWQKILNKFWSPELINKQVIEHQISALLHPSLEPASAEGRSH